MRGRQVGWATLDPIQAPGSAAAGSSAQSALVSSSEQGAGTPFPFHWRGQEVAGSGSACVGAGAGGRESDVESAAGLGTTAVAAVAASGGAGRPASEAGSGHGNSALVGGSVSESLGGPPKRYDYQVMFDAIVHGDYEEPLKFSPEDVSIEKLLESGFKEPLLIGACRSRAATLKALGMKLPAAKLTAASICAALGQDYQAATMNVTKQKKGKPVALGVWEGYFRRTPAQRLKLLNITSLPLTDTPLKARVTAPAVVRALDLIGRVWPAKQQPQPQALLYALMSPKGAYTDFHLDFGGCSAWYHLESGCKVFLLFPPTPHNLEAFERWVSPGSQSAKFYPEMGNGALRLRVEAGETLLLPAGWPHAVATLQDTVAVGGKFLHGLALREQMAVSEMEGRLGVERKDRFPMFQKIHWHAAHHYLGILRAVARTGAADAEISPWEFCGLEGLAKNLNRWEEFGRDDGTPSSIPCAADLASDLSDAFLRVEVIYLSAADDMYMLAVGGRAPGSMSLHEGTAVHPGLTSDPPWLSAPRRPRSRGPTLLDDAIPCDQGSKPSPAPAEEPTGCRAGIGAVPPIAAVRASGLSGGQVLLVGEVQSPAGGSECVGDLGSAGTAELEGFEGLDESDTGMTFGVWDAGMGGFDDADALLDLHCGALQPACALLLVTCTPTSTIWGKEGTSPLAQLPAITQRRPVCLRAATDACEEDYSSVFSEDTGCYQALAVAPVRSVHFRAPWEADILQSEPCSAEPEALPCHAADAMYTDVVRVPQSSISDLEPLGSSKQLEGGEGCLRGAAVAGGTPAVRATAIRASKAEIGGHSLQKMSQQMAQIQMVHITSTESLVSSLPAVLEHEGSLAKAPALSSATDGKARGKKQEAAVAAGQLNEAIETHPSSVEGPVPLQRVHAGAAAGRGQLKGAARKHTSTKSRLNPSTQRGKPSDESHESQLVCKQYVSRQDDSVGQQPGEGGPRLEGNPNSTPTASGGGSASARAETKREVPAYRRNAPAIIKPGSLAHPGLLGRTGAHFQGRGGGVFGSAGGKFQQDPVQAAAVGIGGPAGVAAAEQAVPYLVATSARKHSELLSKLKLQEQVMAGVLQLPDGGKNISLKINELRRSLRELGRPDLAEARLPAALHGGSAQAHGLSICPMDRGGPLALPGPSGKMHQGFEATRSPEAGGRGDSGWSWTGGQPGQLPHNSVEQAASAAGFEQHTDRLSAPNRHKRGFIRINGRPIPPAADVRRGTSRPLDKSRSHYHQPSHQARTLSGPRDPRGLTQFKGDAGSLGLEQEMPAGGRQNSRSAPDHHVADCKQRVHEEAMDDGAGYWTLINALGAEEGPYSVAQLRYMFERGAVEGSTLVNNEAEGVSMILDRMLQQRKRQMHQLLPPPPAQPLKASPPCKLYIPTPVRGTQRPDGHQHHSMGAESLGRTSAQGFADAPPQAKSRHQHQQVQLQQFHREMQESTILQQRASGGSAGRAHKRRRHHHRSSYNAVDIKEHSRRIPSLSSLPAASTATVAITPQQAEECSPILWEAYSPTAAAAAAELSVLRDTVGGAAVHLNDWRAEGEPQIPAAAPAAGWGAGAAVQTEELYAPPVWQPPLPEGEPPPLEHQVQSMHPPLPPISGQEALPPQQQQQEQHPGQEAIQASHRGGVLPPAPGQDASFWPIVCDTSPVTDQALVTAEPAAQQLSGGFAAAAEGMLLGGRGVGGPQLTSQPMVRQLKRQMPHVIPMGPMLCSEANAPAVEGSFMGAAAGSRASAGVAGVQGAGYDPFAVQPQGYDPLSSQQEKQSQPQLGGYDPFSSQQGQQQSQPQLGGYDPFSSQQSQPQSSQQQGYDPFAAAQLDRQPAQSPAVFYSPYDRHGQHAQQAQQVPSTTHIMHPSLDVQGN